MFYFCLLFLITVVVSSPSALVVYPSDLSLDGVLVPVELFLYRISSGHCDIESWPSIVGNSIDYRDFVKKGLIYVRFQWVEIYIRYQASSIHLSL